MTYKLVKEIKLNSRNVKGQVIILGNYGINRICQYKINLPNNFKDFILIHRNA